MGIFGSRIRYRNYPSIDEGALRRVDIVGENSYQENLLQASKQQAKRKGEYLWVALRLEPKNPHDPNAIRVDWVLPDGSGYLTVGYIPRTETAQWRPIVASAPRGVAWCWPAELMGGGRGESIGLYFFT